MQKLNNFYVGFDIGTDSVGYAVTDENYNLIKHCGEPAWGSHIFDAAKSSAERRSFRTARRRTARKKQRIQLVRELFAHEIYKIDNDFYKRLDMSAMFFEDKHLPSANSFFNDDNYKDKDYHQQYPTIHHLICDLMNSKEPHDIRLIYLAISWLVAHRGHFLNEADKDNVQNVLDFNVVYDNFLSWFENSPWECDREKLKAILLKKSGVKTKEKELTGLLFEGKKPVTDENSNYNPSALISLLANGKVQPQKLFCYDGYSNIDSIQLTMNEEKFIEILGELLEDDAALLLAAKQISDWSILSALVKSEESNPCISKAKVDTYNTHCCDLKNLKSFIKKYFPRVEGQPNLYDEIFRDESSELNYVAYAHNGNKRKANKEVFCDFLSKKLKGIECDAEDKPFYDDMMMRLNKDNLSFLPKQVDSDNRLIPYQLYYYELKTILENAENYLPFLKETDQDGLSVADKIISVFLFRIPYFVGPLNNKSDFAWIVRSGEKIYPWNFEKVVDLDKSEQAFIKRMTNTCTYLPGEKVLPKNSLLYSKYSVLNEINNIKINGVSIDVDLKQSIYNNLFMEKKVVTLKQVKSHLRSKGIPEADVETLSGLDIKINSSLKSYHVFKAFLQSGKLTEADVEEIIEALAYSEDKFRLRKSFNEKYPQLSYDEIKYISNQNLKEFGRLSKALLCDIYVADENTGEAHSIIDALWSTNNNLMKLLADDMGYKAQIDECTTEYYGQKHVSIEDRLKEMYVPNGARRPIIRTLDILSDIKKSIGIPSKIFIEMARGATEDQRNKRTVSRKDKLNEFYKGFGDEISQLKKELSEIDDRKLSSEKIYLYFAQLGKCMYTGDAINISDLSSGAYNIDHIYPQRLIKDDSIENKVLVKSDENGRKSDKYPLDQSIQHKMREFWHRLHKSGLIGDKKLSRLTRMTAFTEEEKHQFINRQLVETRQSTKAIATLLKELYPETEIVYVKAGLVSDFRQQYDLLKSRSVNDLHHAKDAYLNIVVGNVYNSVFTKNFNVNSNYSLKVETLFSNTRYCGKTPVWFGEKSIADVKKVMSKNNIHLTRYKFKTKGGLFDQMPLSASAGKLIPRKQGLDTAKYGGYAKATASFFSLVRCSNGKKQELVILPIDLLIADKYLADTDFAIEYAKSQIGDKAKTVDFPLGNKPFKTNTVLSLDGFKVFICGKSGNKIVVSNLTSLVLDNEWKKYIKKLERFDEKLKERRVQTVDEAYDKITKEKNLELYEIYLQKASLPFFSKFLTKTVLDTLQTGRGKFEALTVEEQVKALLSIGLIFKTGRKGTVDLSLIGGKASVGALTLNMSMSNWKKSFKDARIIDESASGIYSKRSVNLLELI